MVAVELDGQAFQQLGEFSVESAVRFHYQRHEACAHAAGPGQVLAILQTRPIIHRLSNVVIVFDVRGRNRLDDTDIAPERLILKVDASLFFCGFNFNFAGNGQTRTVHASQGAKA
jgi:hypothetical protein